MNAATRTVDSVSYVAVDTAGAKVSRAPVQMVREARYVEACRERLENELDAEADTRGATDASPEASIDQADVSFAARGNLVELSGRGRARFGAAFDWQQMSFTCRYDVKKRQATKASYRLEAPRAADTLPPASQQALDGCRAAVEGQVLAEARARGYRRLYRVRIDLPELANIHAAGSRVEVSGRGQFKLDAAHRQPTPMTFSCVYDTATGSVASARFEVQEAAWTPSGEIASGTTGTVRCESPQNLQEQCPAMIKGGVRIIREFGRTPCEAYKNWIWSLNGITVWGGCRADFEFETR